MNDKNMNTASRNEKDEVNPPTPIPPILQQVVTAFACSAGSGYIDEVQKEWSVSNLDRQGYYEYIVRCTKGECTSTHQSSEQEVEVHISLWMNPSMSVKMPIMTAPVAKTHSVGIS
jgi:hypothetical protein